MIEKNVKLSLLYELENLHHVVVQAADVGSKYVYALQLLHKQNDIIVYRTEPEGKHAAFDENDPILYLNGPASGGTAGGHTQTWVYSGEKDRWLVGTKPKKKGNSLYWTTQIARVNLANGHQTINSNTDMPRLSYLNRAGSGYNNDATVYPGSNLERVEAAVSPDYSKLLIASISYDHVGYFALYDMKEVNQALDAAEANADDVNIQNLHCLGAFSIPNFNSELIPSIQGYDIDEKNNVYISCQPGPSTNILGMPKQGKPRQIVKIPWGSTNLNEWEVANLNHCLEIDALGYATEFESVHVKDSENIYLTIAYHSKTDGLTTLMNRIYKINGFND